jgi:hypothetical protein
VKLLEARFAVGIRSRESELVVLVGTGSGRALGFSNDAFDRVLIAGFCILEVFREGLGC